MRRVIGRSPRLMTAHGVRETGVIVAMLAVGLLVRLPNLNAPLLAISSFRQTETAYPALIYHQQGINLLFPQLPVLGKPWQVPFEFPLFQAMAAVLMNLGGAADWAMRVSSVICFVAITPSPFAVTVTVAVPTVADPVEISDRIVPPLSLLSVTGLLLQLVVTPLGSPLTLMLITPL